MIWFEPSDAFCEWLYAYACGRTIVDMGCGEGRLVQRMREKYPEHPTYGVTIWANEANLKKRGIEDYIFLHDAQTSPFRDLHNPLFLICRPSHDGWVADFINELESGLGCAQQVLYVGLRRNYHDDLSAVKSPKVTLELEDLDIGSAELVVSFPALLADPKSYRWWSVRDDPDASHNGMVRATRHGDVIITISGMEIPAKYATPRETVYAENFRLLPGLLPGSKYGVLYPSGRYVSTGYFKHTSYVYDVLGLTEEIAGRLGFVRVAGTVSMPFGHYQSSWAPNEAQAKWLLETEERLKSTYELTDEQDEV
jgi:hypothetical protein